MANLTMLANLTNLTMLTVLPDDYHAATSGMNGEKAFICVVLMLFYRILDFDALLSNVGKLI